MILQSNFLSKLKDFGLNSYESKLWTALLSRGVSTAGELSDIANVPRSRTYDVLESLEKKGFIIMKIGKPIKYIAVSPEEVIERVKKKISENAEEKTMLINEIKDSNILEELNLLHNQGIDLVESTDLVGYFKGRKNIYNQMETMIKNAKHSFIMMTTTEGLLRKKDALIKPLSRAKERGIKIKIAAPITKDTIKHLKELSKIAEIRHTDHNSRFCIADDNEILFMLIDDKDVHEGYDVGVWAGTKLFNTTIKAFFETNWEKMKPISKL